MSHRTTSWRGSLRRAPPDPLGELAAGRRGCAGASPAARAAGRGGGARSGGSGAARAAARAGRRGAPRVAQLGRRSSGRTRGGAGPRPDEYAVGATMTPRRPRRRRRPRPTASASGSRRSVRVVAERRPASPAGAPTAVLGLDAILGSQPPSGRRGRPLREPRAPPPAVEDRVVDLAIVAPPDEDRLRRPPGPCSRSPMSTEGQGAGEVDRRARDRSASPAARSARPNPTASASRRRPSTSGPHGARTIAGSSDRGRVIGPTVRRRARPRSR